MLAEKLTENLLNIIGRPDLRVIAGQRSVQLLPSHPRAFSLTDKLDVILGAPCLAHGELAPFFLRHALELAELIENARKQHPNGVPPQTLTLACLFAARIACLFMKLDRNITTPGSPEIPANIAHAMPLWFTAMCQDHPPTGLEIEACISQLSPFLSETPLSALSEQNNVTLRRAWAQLGPTEMLMARGGDIRLAIDPQTGLNRYGCSHRPRPWAITFASSTASSLSERGFLGAESARRMITQAYLNSETASIAHQTRVARADIAAHFSLDSQDQVILAASGTDCELAALAFALSSKKEVTNILVAPDETGTGVPLAASGRHFAQDTALCRNVNRGQLIDGFSSNTIVLSIAIRHEDGTPRTDDEIDAECLALCREQVALGRHVLLHRLDVSKTGLLAPRIGIMEQIRRELGADIDIVVDACQTRLDPARVHDYVSRGWMVMITGSKFFTGPPFCGALLLPHTVVARLDDPDALPTGLSQYANKCEWPDRAATHCLSDDDNIGLTLRWHAALAEIRALGQLSRSHIKYCLNTFTSAARSKINNSPCLLLLNESPPQREFLDEAWDEIQSILSFLVLTPEDGRDDFIPLELTKSRKLYRWLNSDLSDLATTDPVAGILCHIGQPVPVSSAGLEDGELAGALRISAGARIVSGEPSHEGLPLDARLAREIYDAGRVIAKIEFIMQHWDELELIDPQPTYAPRSYTGREYS